MTNASLPATCGAVRHRPTVHPSIDGTGHQAARRSPGRSLTGSGLLRVQGPTASGPGGGTGPVPTQGAISCEAQLQIEYNSHGAFVPGPVQFNSDNVWSYELGEKWRSSNNRITINNTCCLSANP